MANFQLLSLSPLTTTFARVLLLGHSLPCYVVLVYISISRHLLAISVIIFDTFSEPFRVI